MRKLILPLAILLLAACTPTPKTRATQSYHVRQTLILRNEGKGTPEKQHLWVALIRSIPPYQEVKTRKISPSAYTLLTDEYGNEYAEFDFSAHPPGTQFTVEIEYELSVNELSVSLGDCRGKTLSDYTQPELHIESANPQILSLAKEIPASGANACEKARAYYDYVGDTLTYHFNRNDWGAQAALGPMGADCTEYADLMIALCRAAKIPARYYEGLLYLDETTEGLTHAEHAWLDLNLPGAGWLPADPTLGRLATEREKHFAHYTPNHIIVTTGRNPSTLRGASYVTHLYWPGNSTKIRITTLDWKIEKIDR